MAIPLKIFFRNKILKLVNNRIWSASNSVFAGIRFTTHDGSGTKRYSDLIVEAVLLCFTVKVNLYGASTSSYFYIPQNYVVTLKS